MPIQKVLVVDDSKTELMFLTDLLQKKGMQVRTAENAEEAFRRLGRRKARSDFDGRCDARPKWLSADPCHQPRSSIC